MRQTRKLRAATIAPRRRKGPAQGAPRESRQPLSPRDTWSSTSGGREIGYAMIETGGGGAYDPGFDVANKLYRISASLFFRPIFEI
ncbi:hypothetical protein MRX96_005237 [Rhipicephalus microplus]